ncbi:MAG: murein biosynthesis integral membrane protein MurJ [Epulopiscium sp.]|nr:murein biosynthesis integral membrane protein MurJ [Candidatus Epulonipiscium sp.]
MTGTKQIVKNMIIIILMGLIGKMLGFIREILIGQKFGASLEMDAFLISLSAVLLFSQLITKSLNTTIVPILSEIEKKEGRTQKRHYTNNILNIIIMLSIIIILIAYIFSPLITKILAPGFKKESQVKLTILLIRIGLPVILISGIRGVLRGYLQTEDRFLETAISSFPFNLVYILYLVFCSKKFGIKGLMIVAVLAEASQILLQLYEAKKVEYIYNFSFNLKDKYLKKNFKLIPPILISVGISDINSIIDKSMGSTLIEGSISALNYAEKLNGLVMGLFISAIITVMFPKIAKEASYDSLHRLKKTTIKSVNIIILIVIPATIGMIMLANPIVKTVYERGKFDEIATYMTSGALVFTTLNMFATSLRLLINNVFYALQDTKTPVYMGILAVIMNIIFNFILIKPMAHLGLALATTISSFISCVFLLIFLRKKIGSFGFLKAIKCGLKALVASVVMGVGVILVYNHLIVYLGEGRLNEFITLITSIGVGGLIYLILILFLKIDEVDWVKNIVKEKIKGV